MKNKLFAILLLCIISFGSYAGVWFGENSKGERTMFGRESDPSANAGHYSSRSIEIPTNNPPDQYIDKIFSLLAVIAIIYFFGGESNFKNPIEDKAVRYGVLLVGLIFVGISYHVWNAHNDVVMEWNKNHPKDVAFNKIVKEEKNTLAVKNRAKAELNMDLDSLLKMHGIDPVSEHYGTVITNTINFTNTQSQSQTIYRKCNCDDVIDTVYIDE